MIKDSGEVWNENVSERVERREGEPWGKIGRWVMLDSWFVRFDGDWEIWI